jgi:predicted Zn-dependent protease with MMP-like domain
MTTSLEVFRGANRGCKSSTHAPPRETVRTLGDVKETLLPVLRAAAIVSFSLGLFFVLLNPPSLSGAEGVLAIIAAALLLILAAGWGVVALTGRHALTEAEVDRITRRSEELARLPHGDADATEFERLVADAIDRLPPEFQDLLATIPVVISTQGRSEHAYGQYWGGDLTRGDREHRIVLFQDTLERDFGWDRELLRAQVERTLQHELAHHLGWDEPGVRGLGL